LEFRFASDPTQQLNHGETPVYAKLGRVEYYTDHEMYFSKPAPMTLQPLKIGQQGNGS
jgi:hypothetical protein